MAGFACNCGIIAPNESAPGVAGTTRGLTPEGLVPMCSKDTPTRQCAICGAPLARRQGEAIVLFNARRCCSSACSKALTARTKKERNTKPCEYCGKPYHRSPSEGNRYCSTACQANAARVWRICQHCGKRYSGTGKKYCSRVCWNAARHVEKVEYHCAVCGKSRFDYPYLAKHREKMYCSRRCTAIAYTANLRGKGKPTSIERKTYRALKALGVTFERQYLIGPWVADAYIPETRTVVECMGDYYHANPDLYTEADYTAMQRENVLRDKRKLGWLRRHGYRVVMLWESDINKRGALPLLREAGVK